MRRILSRARCSSCFSRWRSSTLRFRRCSSSMRCAAISSFVARRWSASRTFSSSRSSFCKYERGCHQNPPHEKPTECYLLIINAQRCQHPFILRRLLAFRSSFCGDQMDVVCAKQVCHEMTTDRGSWLLKSGSWTGSEKACCLLERHPRSSSQHDQERCASSHP